LIGPGLVGATLLEQLAGQVERLRREHGVDLRIRAIANRSRMLLDDREISTGRWRAEFEERGTGLDLARFVDHVQTESIPHAVLIDCTADAAIAARYAEWLERGLHVITPNKKANTSDLAYYRRLRASGEPRAHYLYETTVGAGLPVIGTLRELVRTGDEIHSIEGVLSGTLSYLFNSFDGTRRFSDLVREARAKGYTEPDPREDLSGLDVARKVVILAREMGLGLELGDLELTGLVPADARAVSVEQFLDARLPEDDERLAALVSETRAEGQVLRFVGVVDPRGKSSVRLARYPASHPFARIALTDNIVQFRTRRYRDNPLIVQGPGAGPEVTAGGVFADLLRLVSYLGGSL